MDERENLKSEMMFIKRSLENTLHKIEDNLADKYTHTQQSVQHAIEDIAETAHSLSPRRQIQAHPGVFLGGTVLTGYLLHAFATRPKKVVARGNGAPNPLKTIGKQLLFSFIAKAAFSELKRRAPEREEQIAAIEGMILGRI